MVYFAVYLNGEYIGKNLKDSEEYADTILSMIMKYGIENFSYISHLESIHLIENKNGDIYRTAMEGKTAPVLRELDGLGVKKL